MEQLNLEENNEGSDDSEDCLELQEIADQSGDESRSPPPSLEIISKGKRKSGEGSSHAKKRRLSNIDKCLEVLNRDINTPKASTEVQSVQPLNKYEGVVQTLKEIPEYKDVEPEFFVDTMTSLRDSDNCEFFLALPGLKAQRILLEAPLVYGTIPPYILAPPAPSQFDDF